MSDAIPAWWVPIQGEQLRQGDYLPGCFVPLFHPHFGQAPEVTEAIRDILQSSRGLKGRDGRTNNLNRAWERRCQGSICWPQWGDDSRNWVDDSLPMG